MRSISRLHPTCCRLSQAIPFTQATSAGGEWKRNIGSRRPVRGCVYSRIVKLGKGMAAAAHRRYLQRDGTPHEGDRGSLYGPDADPVDAFSLRFHKIGGTHIPTPP